MTRTNVIFCTDKLNCNFVRLADYFKLEAEIGCVRCCQVAITCCLSVDRRYDGKMSALQPCTSVALGATTCPSPAVILES